MYKEIPHFHAFLSLFSRVSCVLGMSLGNGMGAERGPVREKGGECGGFCRAAGPAGGVRGEYGFPEVLPLFPVRGGGACPAADEKCHRENIKKEQKVEFPVPYTWGICPESGVPVPEYFSGRGIPLFLLWGLQQPALSESFRSARFCIRRCGRSVGFLPFDAACLEMKFTARFLGRIGEVGAERVGAFSSVVVGECGLDEGDVAALFLDSGPQSDGTAAGGNGAEIAGFHF